MMGFMDCPECKRILLPSEHGGVAYTEEGHLNEGDKRPIKIEEREGIGPDPGWC
jgi:hypothetical protein